MTISLFLHKVEIDQTMSADEQCSGGRSGLLRDVFAMVGLERMFSGPSEELDEWVFVRDDRRTCDEATGPQLSTNIEGNEYEKINCTGESDSAETPKKSQKRRKKQSKSGAKVPMDSSDCNVESSNIADRSTPYLRRNGKPGTPSKSVKWGGVEEVPSTCVFIRFRYRHLVHCVMKY